MWSWRALGKGWGGLGGSVQQNGLMDLCLGSGVLVARWSLEAAGRGPASEMEWARVLVWPCPGSVSKINIRAQGFDLSWEG